jgi:hypothetical protein
MPEIDDAVPWDFLTLIDWWNLYGLPVLLGFAAIMGLIRGRSRPIATEGLDYGPKTVAQIGLIHCGLALAGLIALVQELLTLRTMGIPESHIGLVGAFFSTLINPVLAIGLLRKRSWGRRRAINWYIILSFLSILVVSWRCYYRLPIALADWPEQLVSKVLPVYLLVVMFLPAIKRVFPARRRKGASSENAIHPQGASQPGEPATGPLVVSLLTLLFLIVVWSNLVVSGADWGHRALFESGPVP